MTDKKKFSAVLADLTLEQAKEWNAETDKFVWVCDNVLDIFEYPNTNSNVNLVEEKLEWLLQVHASK